MAFPSVFVFAVVVPKGGIAQKHGLWGRLQH
uniref:Uncharacterized protein n=1 Tax=mine drainage metagenome TaxID=410659 RepID=E6PZL4_9ZZZZ